MGTGDVDAFAGDQVVRGVAARGPAGRGLLWNGGLAALGMVLAIVGCNALQRPVEGLEHTTVPVVVTPPPEASMALALDAAADTATPALSASASAAPAAPSEEVPRGTIIDTPDAARRLARVIAADILLYN